MPFIELQSVDSTNKYAMALIQQAGMTEGHIGAHPGMVIFAHEQTEGKGQRGRTWRSQAGANIAMSILLNPYPLTVSDGFKLSACTAVAVHEFFSRYAGDDAKIKWPNDIYWRDRKAGGVLIENVIGGVRAEGESQKLKVKSKKPETWKWAVVGIGLNINQILFPADLPNPVSLKQITGKNFEPVLLAKELCSVFEKYFQLLASGNFNEIFNRYTEHLYKKSEKVKLKKGSRVFETTIKAVSETGQLITRHSVEERFEFGEIEWVLA
jgi:BirA family biotin operon repressor/biotin-[acetyl-CoA-carboxylase] ligase